MTQNKISKSWGEAWRLEMSTIYMFMVTFIVEEKKEDGIWKKPSTENMKWFRLKWPEVKEKLKNINENSGGCNIREIANTDNKRTLTSRHGQLNRRTGCEGALWEIKLPGIKRSKERRKQEEMADAYKENRNP